MEVHYYGWSGVVLHHGDTVIGFDLFGENVTWDVLPPAATTILCVTHGHPEHCGSLRRLLSAAGARLAQTHVVSSPAVVAHVTQDVQLPAGNLHPIEDGRTIEIDGVQVSAFAWRHLPLLPSGVGPKVDYAWHLLRRPVELVRIGTAGLRLPMGAPMVGFHIRWADGTTALNYAEGLHRMTHADEVQAVAQGLPATTLLFAVEPEDAAAVPRWIETLAPSTVLLYEAHRPWRELFQLPYIDLTDYAGTLSARFPQMSFVPLLVTS